MRRNTRLWLLWLLLTAALGGWLIATLMAPTPTGELATGYAMLTDKTLFLPGATTAAHHQIEMACTACHGEAFTDRDAIQEACVGCHGDALKAAKDDHPKSKFTDPRNADRAAILDARYCIT